MTMTLKIEHISGHDYAALIKAEGSPDVLVKYGESAEISIHSTKSITITEVGADYGSPAPTEESAEPAAQESQTEGEAA